MRKSGKPDLRAANPSYVAVSPWGSKIAGDALGFPVAVTGGLGAARAVELLRALGRLGVDLGAARGRLRERAFGGWGQRLAGRLRRSGQTLVIFARHHHRT